MPLHQVSNGPQHQQHQDTAEDEIDNDDNNSEASFISNPGMEGSAKRHKSNKPSSGSLRRKSILHTIRNSISTTTDFNADMKDTSDLRRSSRLSLAGGATRIVPGRPTTERSTGLMINGHPVGTNASATKKSSNSVPTKRRFQANRPPFR